MKQELLVGRRLKCQACGVFTLHTIQPSTHCIHCRIGDLYWDLNHWQARVWDDYPEHEHAEIRRYLAKDLADLRALRQAERDETLQLQQGPFLW